MFLKHKKNWFFTLRSTLYILRSLFGLRSSCVLVLLCSCVLFAGCTTIKKVQNMSQLLRLKDYSESQEEIAKDVETQNQMFDEMVEKIEAGRFGYATAKDVFEQFGAPVFLRVMEFEGEIAEQWVYRYAKDFGGDKVYVYFDESGKLINFDYMKRD